MFRENYQHHQQSLLESTIVMDKRIKEKLQKIIVNTENIAMPSVKRKTML